jgi:hypothetical protein
VVTSCLLDEQKSDALDAVKIMLNNILVEMRTWEEAEAAKNLSEDAAEEQLSNSPQPARSDIRKLSSGALAHSGVTLAEEMKTALFKDGKLQLLLKLMGAERVGPRGILI